MSCGGLGKRLVMLFVAAILVSKATAQVAVGAPTAQTQVPLSEHPARSPVDTTHDLEPGEDPENHLIVPLLKHIGSDQKEFWTYPAHLHFKDIKWIAPVAGFTAGVIASDSWISHQLPDKPSQLTRSLHISDYSLYSIIGIGGGSYLLGKMAHNDHLSETGLLAGEAAIDGTGVAYLIKAATERERPNVDSGKGHFLARGQSFPSEHSTIAWSVASLWAHEYPGTLSQIFAYGLASAVTVTRATSQQHFSSDVFVGGALGWYFGREVYRSHHNRELAGAAWGSSRDKEEGGERVRDPRNMGSPYVPLDSWIYPAMERLEAMDYINNAYLGMRPWTRMECVRLLEEAGDKFTDETDENNQARKLYAELKMEFALEADALDGGKNFGANIDSVYSRATEISGSPLTDGYHFGQTIVNDYGRPYSEGFNNVTGLTSHAEAGPLSISVQGEFQHAPMISSDPSSVLNAIAAADITSPVSNARPETNRFELLDATVSATFHNTQFSFGKESQWLGPGESGSLLYSDNAEPMVMLKIDSVSPYNVPLLSRVLGPIRTEYFIGQLQGQEFELNGSQLLGPGNIHPQPFLDGAKISFKPTSNLEIGMGFTAQFAGPGLPFNFHNFLRTFFSHTSGNTADNNNPGKRLSSADIAYRVPGLRNWLTFYLDTLVVDEVSPLGSTRATVNPGIYLPQIPKIPNLEIRAEGIHEPLTNEFSPGFVYYGLRRYRSGYTNDGNLIGNWAGRAGRGGQGWVKYSWSARSSLQLGYRLQEVSHDFIGGGRLADYSARGDIMISRNVSVLALMQYEQWAFPMLSLNQHSNLTTSFQVTFHPKLRTGK